MGLLEHHSSSGQMSWQMAALVQEVVDGSRDLIRHNFGHHVMQTVLEHGSDQHRSLLHPLLMEDLLQNASHRSAAYVIEKALVFCNATEQCSMAIELLKDATSFVEFSSSQYGCRVAAALLRISNLGLVSQTQGLILSKSSELGKSKYGRRLLEELRRFGLAIPSAGPHLNHQC